MEAYSSCFLSQGESFQYFAVENDVWYVLQITIIEKFLHSYKAKFLLQLNGHCIFIRYFFHVHEGDHRFSVPALLY